jgi:hypothetical protein
MGKSDLNDGNWAQMINASLTVTRRTMRREKESFKQGYSA